MSEIKVGANKIRFPRKIFEQIAGCQLYYGDFQLVKLAYRLSKYGHKGQYRLDKTRYFEHAKAVALIIMLEFGIYQPNPIIVALMHDLREDSHILSWWDIEHIFGKDVYRGLRILTKEEGKDYYQDLKRVQKSDWWIQLVKLADILHNLRTMTKTGKKFRSQQLKEKEKEYKPLLESMSKNLPNEKKYIIAYLKKELELACKKVRQSLEKNQDNKKTHK